MSWHYGTNPQPYPLELGTLWRYNDGPTALCKLKSLHEGANGYHAQQCMGGLIFVTHNNIVPATDAEYKTWYECEHWRKVW